MILAKQKRQAEAQAAALLTETEGKQKALLLEAREEVHQIRRSAENEYKERRNEVRRQEKRLTQKEETLDRKVESVDRRLQNLSDKEEALDRKVAEAEELKELQLQKLETISSLTVEEARDRVIGEAIEAAQGEIDRRTYELELRMKEDADMKARKAIALSIQRLTSDVVSETTSAVIPLPSDDMKGRLIGREGRNIRALERATGVDLIIDDTPEAVTVSTFDPRAP